MEHAVTLCVYSLEFYRVSLWFLYAVLFIYFRTNGEVSVHLKAFYFTGFD